MRCGIHRTTYHDIYRRHLPPSIATSVQHNRETENGGKPRPPLHIHCFILHHIFSLAANDAARNREEAETPTQEPRVASVRASRKTASRNNHHLLSPTNKLLAALHCRIGIGVDGVRQSPHRSIVGSWGTGALSDGVPWCSTGLAKSQKSPITPIPSRQWRAARSLFVGLPISNTGPWRPCLALYPAKRFPWSVPPPESGLGGCPHSRQVRRESTRGSQQQRDNHTDKHEAEDG
ncbi:hypothetical protein B0H65DRAFT_108283 [Neurospora tetraspora]|uniref:Uncharacterized protein n=1 Tax=Neurospora tetraspora TaxID=94610 RepID=A0AAE0JJW4_9PEZI|nr:hypothetical protein B0H65DRAFT_108283 [Neurospora tetraspora]